MSKSECSYTTYFVYLLTGERHETTRKVPKLSDARKLCCNISEIQTKRLNLRVLCQKDANEIANSEDPDQTSPI